MGKQPKEGIPKRKSYTMVEEDDDDDTDLNAQMVLLEDNFVLEAGIDCSLTQEAEEEGLVYAPYFPDDLVDDLHVVLAISRGVRKAVQAIDRTKDPSREAEIKV